MSFCSLGNVAAKEKEPQATTGFALHEKDDLDDDYVLIEKVNSKNIQPMLATQSPINQYLPNRNQASKSKDTKIELFNDYICIERPYIRGSKSQIDQQNKPKNLEKGQSTHNTSSELEPENVSKDQLKIKEKVQEERHESSSTQELKAENMKLEPVVGSDTMWFWNEDERRLEHIQDPLKKILGDYQKINEAPNNLSKKEETINPTMKFFGIRIGANVNRLPPNHKVNKKFSKRS
ncbi:uncharacterized protein MELLADRAFT_106682 [Melampsora larici-populina 98AG31]|uniref:Uncharacterized protein n=1 Tax=Melampsora larici-populina (strain 98AG31 / pathotype 3-4-7) TaxID=747676 RepID=F4RMA5_MELLP|nr:uncharacterized protein MELLADRAFT_106682 [Melampsora larici-populina 98AG31]EGG06390.1 hypothetical protein MELLADRAFT_106682 [Melampsora larici-populina 98AG31]